MPRIFRLPLPAALVLFLLMLLPSQAPAASSPAWLGSQSLSTIGEESSGPAVAFNGEGFLAAAWFHHQGGHTVIQASTRTPGSSWTIPSQISATGGDAQGAKVGVDAAGNVTVVWEQGSGQTFVIYEARLTAGSWTNPVAISSTTGDSRAPALAVSPDGEATVLWAEEDSASGENRIRASWRSANGSWSTPIWLGSTSLLGFNPQLGVDSHGTVTAAWEQWTAGGPVIETASRPAGGGWSATHDLIPSTGAEHFPSEPDVAVDAEGDAAVIWIDEIEGEGSVIEAATRPAGGSWSNPARLSAAGGELRAPQVGIDAAGDATAVWPRKSGGLWTVEASERPAAGAWTTATAISVPGAHTFNVAVGVTPAGEAIAGWERNDGSNVRIQSAERTVAGAWSTPGYRSPAGVDSGVPAIDVDDHGDAVLTWENLEGGKAFIQAAGYDGGPQLRQLSIPASGTTGEPVSLSVTPFSVWSSVTGTEWEFGDGEEAGGNSVAHSYSGAGGYEVTVTSTDISGATRSATETVFIAGGQEAESDSGMPSDLPLDGLAVEGKVESIARSGNRVYVGGEFGFVGEPARGAAMIDPETGALESSSAFEADGSIDTAVPDGSGGYYLGGEFERLLGGRRAHLAHVMANGELDRGFTFQADGQVTALYRHGSTLIVGGSFTHLGGQSRPHLAAINLDTEELNSWNPAPNGAVKAVAFAGPYAYIGGTFTSVGGEARNHLAAIEPGSNLPTAWNPEPNGSVKAIVADERGVYFGGGFTELEGGLHQHLAEYDPVNERLAGWNPTPNGEVTSLALTGGNVYVGGSFSEIGGRSRSRLAAVGRASGEATSFHPPAPSAAPNAIAIDGSTLYATGAFSKVGGEPRANLAAFNTTNGVLRGWNPGLGAAGTFVLARSGGILVGGAFQVACGEPRQNLAALDSSTAELLAWNPAPDGRVWALAADSSTVYIGGTFTKVGGLERSGLAALDAASGAATSWDPNPSGTVSTLLIHESTLYAGGSFTTIAGATRKRLAAFETSTGALTAWSPNVSGTVAAMAVYGSNLAIGGSFTEVGGLPHRYVAAVELGNGSARPWSVGADSPVQSVAATAGTVYIGGSFVQVGGAEHPTVAAINPVTGEVTNWNPGVEGIGKALALGGSRLYIGTVTELIAVDAESGDRDSWEPRPERNFGGVQALATSGSTVYVGGDFDGFGGRPHEGFAAFGQPLPTDTAAPAVTGVAQAGHSLSCSTGTWSGKVIAYARQWLRDGVPIGGATGGEYAVSPTDVDHAIACRVSATNDTGTSAATSAALYIASAGGPGSSGERGEKGATGEAGAPGQPGEAGAQGPAGATGATGAAGASGATGATGASGANGATGATGATGPEGAAGVAVKVSCRKQGSKYRCTVSYRAEKPAKVAVLRGGKVAARGRAQLQGGRDTYTFTVSHGTYLLESTEQGGHLVTQIWVHV